MFLSGIVCFSQYQTMSILACVKPSLFQAGSGKSYLMAGNDQELGIAPMVCMAIREFVCSKFFLSFSTRMSRFA